MILSAYIKEFVGIGNYLKTINCRKKECFVIPKEELLKLLDQNKYDTAQSKLKIWKALNWIDAGADRATKRIYNKATGTYIPSVKLYVSVYEMLKLLSGK